MIVRPYYLGCLAHASYLVGDPETHVAAVVDPQRDLDQYLADGERLGVEIQHVVLTHFHADFVAGHLELRDQAGARIYIGRRGKAEYSYAPVGMETRSIWARCASPFWKRPGTRRNLFPS
jgi:glyoxylase-like metal-dependent hydrolase (beta-lactamase superfamily II)